MTTGTIGKQLKNFTRESDKYFVNNINIVNNDFRQLIVNDYIGVIAVLISGFILSSIVLIFEIFIINFNTIYNLYTLYFLRVILIAQHYFQRLSP